MPQNKNNNSYGKRVRLRVMGISYSQIQSGAYALILAQADGPYRIPVVVGAAEAQAIAIKMEGIIPPRPMTHDLFTSLCLAFRIELKEVFIHKFEDGIFSSDLTFIDSLGNEVIIDARTSDAIAIAMRTQTPIYTTPEILAETGFLMEVRDTTNSDVAGDEDIPGNTDLDDHSHLNDNASLEKLPDDTLNEMLQKYILNEQYELAAGIKKILDSRK